MYAVFHIIVCILACFVLRTRGNTEKSIFQSPGASITTNIDMPVVSPTHDSRVGRLIFELETPFSTANHSGVTEQWFRLDNLGPRWKYEIRLCWPAIVR